MSKLEFNVGDKVLINPTSTYCGLGPNNPSDTVGEVTRADEGADFPYDVTWENDRNNDYPEGALIAAGETSYLASLKAQLDELTAKYEALEKKQQQKPVYRKVSFESREAWAAAMAGGRVFYSMHTGGGIASRYFCDIENINGKESPFRLDVGNNGDSMPLLGCWVDWETEELYEEHKGCWYDNIPKGGVMCYCWDDDFEYRTLHVVVNYEPANIYPYFTLKGAPYTNA